MGLLQPPQMLKEGGAGPGVLTQGQYAPGEGWVLGLLAEVMGVVVCVLSFNRVPLKFHESQEEDEKRVLLEQFLEV